MELREGSRPTMRARLCFSVGAGWRGPPTKPAPIFNLPLERTEDSGGYLLPSTSPLISSVSSPFWRIEMPPRRVKRTLDQNIGTWYTMLDPAFDKGHRARFIENGVCV